MKEINLLQSQKKSGFSSISTNFSGSLFLWIFLGLLAVEAAAFGSLYFLKNQTIQKTASLQSEMADINKKLKNPPKEVKEAIQTQSSLKSLGELLDSHLYWTQVWKELGRTTLKKAQYFNLNAVSGENRFSLQGIVSTYHEVGQLMLGLQNSSQFTEVELITAGKAEGDVPGVEFNIAVKFKPELLLKSVNFQKASSTPATIDSKTGI